MAVATEFNENTVIPWPDYWVVDAIAGPLTNESDPHKVFDVCVDEKEARERASRLRLKGYRVFGWDMFSGGGRFTPKA